MSSRKHPLQIGVTGGIGSGKSVVCRLFACLDIPVYDADTRARWITTHDIQVKVRIVELLGNEAYTALGDYNRAFVASKVFNDPVLLKSLNEIVHPAVAEDTERWVKNHSASPYVVKEAAIMNRAGQANKLDYVIVVSAPVDIRIKRILSRDKRSEDEVRAIISRQVSEKERMEMADFIINNDETQALIPQVMALHEVLSRLASDRD